MWDGLLSLPNNNDNERILSNDRLDLDPGWNGEQYTTKDDEGDNPALARLPCAAIRPHTHTYIYIDKHMNLDMLSTESMRFSPSFGARRCDHAHRKTHTHI